MPEIVTLPAKYPIKNKCGKLPPLGQKGVL
jgi:hypothetical protein